MELTQMIVLQIHVRTLELVQMESIHFHVLVLLDGRARPAR